jgi:hypothetical protein
MPEITFPTSTAPGVNPTENGGRLINCYAEAAPPGSRSKVIWRRAPGLTHAFSTIETEARGSLLVGSVIYIISGDKAYSVTSSYVVTELTGTVGGSGPVFMARNMAATPDVLIVHSAGMSQINTGAASVSDFSDGDLPAVNSICWIDGYFIVTSAAGKAYQSGINATTFSSVDFTTAEADPDGLYRAVALGSDLLLMGAASIEFYGNAGNATGFAFSRGPVIPVGLKGPYAVAGFETGFSDNLIYVANDNTVRKQEGYTPTKISTPELERFIEAVTDVTTLEASVFVAAGHAYWVLTGPDWTWVYDVSTGNWHERASYGEERWRGRFGVNAWDKWFVFDRDSEKVFQVSATVKREDDQPLLWELHSVQAHRFPGKAFIKRASFDFVTGVGIDAGIDPIESDPVVRISWSFDGGRTFGQPLTRELGTQGQDVPIDIFRCGLTNRRGVQWRLQCSDPIELAFIGGAMDVEERKAS